MAEIVSILRSARISPLKAREVARAIQGRAVSDALTILNFTPKKAANLLSKTLRSAAANAENNHNTDPDTLYIKEATVSKGPMQKRFMARARGSGAPIRRRSSFIKIVLAPNEGELT